MTDMITRVSRAILKRRYYEPQFHTNEESFFTSCDPELVMEAEADARAAIEAMREPTDEMIAAGWRSVTLHKQRAGIARLGPGPSLSDGYTAMLDAALASPTLEDAGER